MNTTVAIVESYLRLNGYLTVTEFQVQHAVRDQPDRFETATDLDVIALRFPWAGEAVLRHARRDEERRCEILIADDAALASSRDRPDVLIAEVKEGAGQLNRRLRTPDVLYAALRRAGCCPDAHIGVAAAELLEHGMVELDAPHAASCRIRLASFCGRMDASGPPAPLTITLDHVIDFLLQRLADYRSVLRSAQFADPVLHIFKLLSKLDLPPRGNDRDRTRFLAPLRSERQIERNVRRDPVCGMEVNGPNAAFASTFQRTTYYFCSAGCKFAFDKDPRRYVAH